MYLEIDWHMPHRLGWDMALAHGRHKQVPGDSKSLESNMSVELPNVEVPPYIRCRGF